MGTAWARASFVLFNATAEPNLEVAVGMLVWVGTSLLLELREAFHHLVVRGAKGIYLEDPLNYLELLSLALLAGVLLRMNLYALGLLDAHGSSADAAWSDQYWASSASFTLGLVTLYLSTGLRVLMRVSNTGPLVMMLVHMVIYDVTRWLAILLALLVAFSAGLHHLMRNQVGYLDCPLIAS